MNKCFLHFLTKVLGAAYLMIFESEEIPCSTLQFNPFFISIFWLSVTNVISTIYSGITQYCALPIYSIYLWLNILKRCWERFINIFKRHHLQVNYTSKEHYKLEVNHRNIYSLPTTNRCARFCPTIHFQLQLLCMMQVIV